MRHLIYGLVDPLTLLVRYVGLSATGMKRPRQHQRRTSEDTYCAYWIAKLARVGLTYEIAVLEEVVTRDALADAERWWIAYGRACGWPLTNLTDGGDGLLNPSTRTREKLASLARERMGTAEARAKSSVLLKQRWMSPEYRKAMVEAAHARMNEPARRLASSEAQKVYWSPEAREQQRSRSRAAYQSAELRAVVGAASKARMSTPEARARQSALTSARLSTPEQRAAHAEKIRKGMAAPGVRAKLIGDANPAKRPEVREKMRAAWERRRAAKAGS